jgi:hypothetical protein
VPHPAIRLAAVVGAAALVACADPTGPEPPPAKPSLDGEKAPCDTTKPNHTCHGTIPWY